MAPRLLYIHVPKCGGTSFGSAVRLAYATSQATIRPGSSRAICEALYPGIEGTERTLRQYEIRTVLLGDLMGRGVACISAHVPYNAGLHERLDPDRKAVTLLREPVARFLSHYAYVQRHHPGPARAAGLEDFLDTEAAQRFGSTYLFYFAGRYQHHVNDLERALGDARTNMARFTLIGDLSRTEAFRKGLRQIIGRPVVSWTRNRRPETSNASRDVAPGLRERIERLCAPDRAIYEHAQGLPTCV